MAPNHDPIIGLSPNTWYVPLYVDTKEDESVWEISIVDNPQPSSQPAASTPSYSWYPTINSSTYAVSPSTTLDPSFTSYYKIPDMTQSMYEAVNKMCSEFTSYIYVQTNPVSSSENNNLQYSFNNETEFEYHITKLSV